MRAWSRNIIKISLHELFWTSCSLSVQKGHDVNQYDNVTSEYPKKDIYSSFFVFLWTKGSRCLQLGLSLLTSCIAMETGQRVHSFFLFFSQVLTLDARAGAGGGRLLPDASQLTPGIARKHGQTQENTYRTPPVLWKKENGKVARGLSIFFSHFSFIFFSRFLF